MQAESVHPCGCPAGRPTPVQGYAAASNHASLRRTPGVSATYFYYFVAAGNKIRTVFHQLTQIKIVRWHQDRQV